MPRWLSHGRALTALVRRWGTNFFFPEVLSGILPTIQVDKHWPADRLSTFAIRMEIISDGANFPAMMLSAGDVDLHLYKIEAHVDDLNFGETEGHRIHLFTPLPGYNPCNGLTAPVFAWFPWLLNARETGTLGALPDMIGVSGHEAALQVVNIVGIGAVTTIGPEKLLPNTVTTGGGAGVSFLNQNQTAFWEFQDPPMRIAPFTRMAIQLMFVPAINRRFVSNWFFSTREAQGLVG